MATGDVRERDLGALREVVASLREPSRGIAPNPDAVWHTPTELLSRDPERQGVRWASLVLLRDVLHCDEILLEHCDTARRRRTFGQGVAPAGPDYLQIPATGPNLAADDPRLLDPWFLEAEAYYWSNYETHAFGYAYRTGDWDAIPDAPMVRRDPLIEERTGREPVQGWSLMATAPLGAESNLQLLCLRWDRTPFSERERGMLELLKPHFVEAWVRSCAQGPSLTAAQRRVLALVRDGLTNRQIARELGISEATVRTHLQNAYEALGVNNRVAAVAAAFGTPHVPVARTFEQPGRGPVPAQRRGAEG